MSTVTIATEDLRALIFAAKASSQIENVLAERRRDPFVKAEIKNLAPIMDRVERQWREAERAEQFPWWNDPLSEKDAELLLEFDEEPELCTAAEKKSRWDSLGKRGMVELGVPVHGVAWAGQPAEWESNPRLFLVRPTARGLKAIADLKEKAALEITNA